MKPKHVALAAALLLTSLPSQTRADPARDALACAGFWQANYLYERQTFQPVDVNEAWAEMAEAGTSAAIRLGATQVDARVAATAQDMLPRLQAFLFGGDRRWFETMSRLCGRVIDREPELTQHR